MRTFRLHLPDGEYQKIEEVATAKELTVDEYIQTALYLMLHDREMRTLLEINLEAGRVLGKTE